MSRTVDERVVSMEFDNKQFEKNISTTMSSLEKFNKTLDMTGASKGLENVADATKKIDMSGLSSAVETVRSKFSALEVIGVTALMNLTNSAVNAGKRIISALTIDPVTTGFSEYELKMGSIQTIMAGTGESLETVNKYLEELNAYSDKTIYSFSDMTNNIGKFTNAGVSLENAVAAIKGVSNVAALSGANSNEASRAMYNFSQALSAGYVKLMDWKSIENANMATVGFKDQLIKAAVAAGTLTETSDGMYKTLNGTVINATQNFNDSLQDQWMTTDVLISTLKEYTDETTEIGKKATAAAQDVKTLSMLWDTLKESAQSGWAQTWEILVGDFEEGKKLWTEVNNAISPILEATANARNDLLKTWKELGGRTQILDALRSAFEGVMNISSTVKEAFDDIFAAIKPEDLLKVSEGIKKFAENFKAFTENSEAMDKIKRTAKGLFAIFDIGLQVVKALGRAFSQIVGHISPAGEGLLSFTAILGDGLVKFDNFIKSSNVLNKVIDKVSSVFGKAVSGVRSFVNGIKEAVREFSGIDTSGMDSFAEKVKTRFAPLSALGEGVINIFKLIAKIVQKVAPLALSFASKIGELFRGLTEGLLNAVDGADFSSAVDVLNGVLSGGILVAIKKFIDTLSGSVEDAGGIFSNASGFLGGLKDVLDGVKGSLEAYQSSLKADTLLKIAGAIAILAASLAVMSLIDSERLNSSLGAMTALFAELMGSMAIFSKISGSTGKMATSTAAILGLSSAMLILSISMKILSTMSVAELTKGLVGVAVGLGILVGAVNLLPSNNVKKAANAISKMSSALLVLSIALKIMGSMTWDEMGKGLVGMAAGLGALVLAVNLLPKDTALKTAGMIGLATAMVILGAALKIIGSMSWGEMGVALVGLAGALTILVTAITIMAAALPGAAAMLIIAPALVVLAASLKILGSMSWGEMGVALVALAGSLTILAIAMITMIAALPGAAAMLVIAPALLILATTLQILGGMSLGEIGKGLLALAGVFTILGIAGIVLAPITPIILALAAAVALFGVGCIAAGAGVLAFAAGLSALAVAGSAGAAALVLSITSLLGLIPMILQQVGYGIVALCGVISNSATAICGAVTAVLLGVISALTDCIPPLLECLGVLLDSLLSFILVYVPKIVDVGIDLIIALLDGIASKLPDIIQSAFNIVISFIDGLANAIRNNNERINSAIKNLFTAMIDAVKQNIASFRQAGKDVISGFIKGIKDKISDAVNAAKGVVSSALEGAKKLLGIHSPSKAFAEVGKYADEGLIVGLKKFAGKVSKTAGNVATSTVDALSKPLSTISDVIDGNLDVQPTIRPVIDLAGVQKGARTLNNMFGSAKALSVSASMNSSAYGINQNGTSSTANGNVYQFTQNNYSPKSLSRIDIYRQTQNQFSAFEREVALK